MKRFILIFGFLLLTALPALAALPPLSNAERQEEATVVVRGEIISIESRKKRLSWGSSNLEMILSIKVSESMKGGLEPGTIVMVQCWVADDRPDGWVGDGGQRPTPRKGAKGLFYAEDKGGDLHLLHPNGWDPE